MSEIVTRVLQRYASTLLDDKMRALLLKLRKGADSTLSQAQLFKVLALLGGWRVEEFVGLVKEHGFGHGMEDAPKLLAEGSENTAQVEYDQLKRQEVSVLPANPKAGEKYVMDLGAFRSWEAIGHTMYGTEYRMWIGAAGYRFTDPNGKVFELLPSKFDLHKALKTLPIYDVMRWLKGDSTYLTQINELLGTDPHEKAAPRTRENTGTCAVCFRNIKLVQKSGAPTMALHGYNRPGYGYVVGRCWGGNHQPYELSPEATSLILKSVEEVLTNSEEYLHKLQSGHLEEFDEHRWWGSTSIKTIRKTELSPESWQYMLKQHIADTEGRIKGIKKQVKIYDWLVNSWEKRDLPQEGSRHIDWFEEAVTRAR